MKELGVNDICYSTIKTSLELLKITFSIPPEEYCNIGLTEDFEYDIFRVILKLNQDLFFYQSDSSLQCDEQLYFNLFAKNDFNNISIESVFQIQCYYTSELFNFLEQYHLDVLSKLLKYWKITDYKQYILTIYSIFLHCFKQQQKYPYGYWLLDFDKIPFQDGLFCLQVANNLSIGINEIIPHSSIDNNQRSDNTDYRIFRSRPLIHLSENKYYVCNLQLLLERTYNSLFFDLKNILKDNSFGEFFNKQFVEHSLFRHTMELCSNKNDYIFPTRQIIESSNIKEFSNQPDFYIRRGGNLTLFECKAFKLNGSLKDNAEVQEFLRELKLKIYESTENIDKSRKSKNKSEPVGVTQLVAEIEKIEDNNFPFDSKIPDDVKYYPIIVLEDPRFIQPGLISIVNRWSKKLLAEKLKDAAYYPIIVTSIDVLFLYRETFRKLGFPKIIDHFIQSKAKLNENKVDWEVNPMADFNDFVKSKYKMDQEKNKKWLECYKKDILTNIYIVQNDMT